MSKDHFSDRSDAYLTFRPHYPEALFQWIQSQNFSRGRAWDCATGNGQFAQGLIPIFEEVFASDMSEEQIKHALQTDRIKYSKQWASKTDYPNQFFQFVSVAQAIHWFDFEAFYQEVRRITTPDAVLLVCGYEKIRVNEEVDALVETLYNGILSDYWDPERQYIEAQYQTIHFPFTEIETPPFTWRAQWSLQQLLGYLGTWSALKKYIQIHHEDPLEKMQASFEAVWGEDQTKPIEFPIILRVGYVHA